MPACAEYLKNGVCTIPQCSKSHTVRLCRTCRVWCPDENVYKQHLRGKKHSTAVRRSAAGAIPSWCDTCNIPLSSDDKSYKLHIAGKKHRRQLAALAQGTVQPTERNDNSTSRVHCTICNIYVLAHSRASHERSDGHRKKQQFATYRAAFDEAERNKAGVSVSDSALLFVDAPVKYGTAVTTKTAVNVTFDSADTQVYLSGVRMSSSFSARGDSHFTTSPLSAPIHMANGRTASIEIHFDSKGTLGQFEDRIEFAFEDRQLDKRFSIVRQISCVVGNRADHEAIRAVAPYVPRQRGAVVAERDLQIEEAPLPPSLSGLTCVAWPGHYAIPKKLEDVMASTDKAGDLVKQLKTNFLPPRFNTESYPSTFHTLLHVEEAQLQIDIETFNMENVTMDPVSMTGCYRLSVPGLAERRPSLIVGDRILVQDSGIKSKRWWEGRVYHVRMLEVDLKFKSSFQGYRGQKYDVRFRLNRTVLQRMHQALDTTFLRSAVLFPTPHDFNNVTRPTSADLAALHPRERKIASNEKQCQAVLSIVQRKPGSPPFVVFGPPGTGKTITIVEAMRQLTLARPDTRILACAPSNSAADLITERLIGTGLGPTELFRLNAVSRAVESLPAGLLPYCRLREKQAFLIPAATELEGFRVIVATCASAGMPASVGVPRGHFTHVFIDEAGQASEPEAMISIKMSADNNTNIVLAGDPKQLGPIIHSRAAQTLGLQLSFLDRLMARDVYAEPMRGISFVKLTKNFRSHEAILKFPNEHFYANELEACGDPSVTHSLIRSDVLVRQGVPIVFENLAGKDGREARSPSFFNVDEASRVKRYVEELLSNQKLRLTGEHIGIIAPYHAQVLKIRALLKNNVKANKVKVGSVEEFQGGERRVIIISTVRSSRDFVSYDLRHTLGFVANPRRFNVAVTRAQALLIVVGDANVLALDPLWRAFMNYVHKAGGWRGKAPAWDLNEAVVEMNPGYDRAKRAEGLSEMEAFVERTKDAVLHKTCATNEGAEGGWDGVEDKEWREAE